MSKKRKEIKKRYFAWEFIWCARRQFLIILFSVDRNRQAEWRPVHHPLSSFGRWKGVQSKPLQILHRSGRGYRCESNLRMRKYHCSTSCVNTIAVHFAKIPLRYTSPNVVGVFSKSTKEQRKSNVNLWLVSLYKSLRALSLLPSCGIKAEMEI